MSTPSQNLDAAPCNEVRFPPTHWSLVLSAGQPGSPEAEAALASLCQRYWYPVYAFVRRQGHKPDDAQVLAKNYFAAADPEKGRFSSFLMLALKRFMANEWDRANRQKRGGGAKPVPLDGEQTETRYLAEPSNAVSPEKAFERRWALTLLQQVWERIEAEFSGTDRACLFDELKIILGGAESETSYAEVSRRLRTTEGTVKVTVYRLRKRYRELLRLEIADTVDSPEAVNDEIRDLFAA